jgi:hypothetical protein
VNEDVIDTQKVPLDGIIKNICIFS